ncbi:hypothetical protein SAT01_36360 [Sinomonas atrocyanea]|nr:hypothetical protein SAT01_36360 [Sinomonas atrocyanea]GGG55644.1 hypothetical protein GCM10007172_03270 [Sinomonas atrocyanea]
MQQPEPLRGGPGGSRRPRGEAPQAAGHGAAEPSRSAHGRDVLGAESLAQEFGGVVAGPGVDADRGVDRAGLAREAGEGRRKVGTAVVRNDDSGDA